MRLLFVHEVNWREKPVYEVHDFPEQLALRGHEISIIDFAEGEKRTDLRRLLDLRTEVRLGQSRAHPGSSVKVITPGRGLAPPLDRLAASLTQVPAIWKALRDGSFDAVVLYGVPTNGWQTVRIAKHFGVPVLFRAIDISHLLRRSIYSPLIKRAERSVYRRADWVSTHNVPLRDYAIARGANPDTMSIDLPGVDLRRFRPRLRDPALSARIGIAPNDRVLLFMGTLYRFAGLTWFLEAIAPRMLGESDLKLLLVGGGEAESQVRASARRLGVDQQVLFSGWAGYDELADHLCLGDVAINSLLPQPVTNCALPGKVFQYLACGIPTVSTPLEGLRGVLPDGSGVVYGELGDDFIAQLNLLLDDGNLRRTIGARGRTVLEECFAWDGRIEQFESVLEDLVSRKR